MNLIKKIPKFNYKFANWQLFQANLLLKNTNNLISSNTTVDDLFSSFQNMILECAENTIPMVKSNPGRRHKGNVWWTVECEHARQEKWMTFKKYLKEPTAKNLLESKKAKNKSNRVNKEAKKAYWEKFCTEELSPKIKISDVWKKVKTLKTGIQVQSFPVIIENNELPSQTDKAEKFVDVFAVNSCLAGLNLNDREYRLNIESNNNSTNNPQPNDANNCLNTAITKKELIDHLHLLS